MRFEGFADMLLQVRPRWPLNLFVGSGAVDKAQGSTALGARVVFIAIEGSNGLGDMVARVRDGELADVAAATAKVGGNLVAGPR